jgi:hypothetical protein
MSMEHNDILSLSWCRWLLRFENKFRLDPDFLTRQADKL